MKKLGLIILGCCLLLGIVAPMINVDARDSGAGTTSQLSSFHSLAWGHHNGEAFTEYTLRHSTAWAEVWRVNSPIGMMRSARAGQAARATVVIGANIAREHLWR